MSVQPFLMKEHQGLPDFYDMTIHFHDSKSVDFEAVSHAIKDGILEIVTKEDVWNLIPLTSIKRLEFGKSFSKMIAIKKEASLVSQDKS